MFLRQKPAEIFSGQVDHKYLGIFFTLPLYVDILAGDVQQAMLIAADAGKSGSPFHIGMPAVVFDREQHADIRLGAFQVYVLHSGLPERKMHKVDAGHQEFPAMICCMMIPLHIPVYDISGCQVKQRIVGHAAAGLMKPAYINTGKRIQFIFTCYHMYLNDAEHTAKQQPVKHQTTQ